MAFGEKVAADEEQRFRGFGEEIVEIQNRRAAETGLTSRGLHNKQHLGAVGELLVRAVEGKSYGVFASPGKAWPVYVRFSNGNSRRQRDHELDVRGMALKLVGVPGPKLIAGLEREQTQDFLFIDTPSVVFRDPDEFMQFVRAAKQGPKKLVPNLFKSFGIGRTLGILWRTLRSEKVKSFATHSFHTAAPIAFGASAAKLALVPASNGSYAPSVSGDDFLREDLAARLRQGPLSWTLRAQLFVDETSTPIEDTSVEWQGPFFDLATLTLPQQDTQSPRGKEISELVDRLSFDPWHATEDHRPLGAMMRARGPVYAASVTTRQAASEPKTVLTSD
jgi:hypothetical protein